MRTLVSLTETFCFLSEWFKTVFMVGSENVGNGEIKERNRTVVYLLVRNFLRVNLVWKEGR